MTGYQEALFSGCESAVLGRCVAPNGPALGLKSQCGGKVGIREAKAAGLDAVGMTTDAPSRAHYYPGAEPMKIKLIVERARAARWASRSSAGRVQASASTCWPRRCGTSMTVAEVAGTDLSCAPPFSPVWDPVLLAAGKAASEV